MSSDIRPPWQKPLAELVVTTPTLQTLNDIITNAEPETLVLEFKGSPSLDKAERAKTELSKDVSAMANSAGGRIIYGVEETDHVPQRLDAGSDDTVIDREWLEQVISSRIQPKIEGLIITPIIASPGRTYYVLDVPQATSRAPHQAFDKRYYKRHNFMATAMEDYEIKDTMRRATTPVLRASFLFVDGNATTTIDFTSDDRPHSTTLSIVPTMRNLSVQPVQNIIFEVYFQPQMILGDSNIYAERNQVFDHEFERLMRVKRTLWGVMGQMPVFKEAEVQLPAITFNVPRSATEADPPIPYPFAYRIRCPGYDIEEWGSLHIRGNQISIDMP